MRERRSYDYNYGLNHGGNLGEKWPQLIFGLLRYQEYTSMITAPRRDGQIAIRGWSVLVIWGSLVRVLQEQPFPINLWTGQSHIVFP
ncbi:MAG: hypothetical protein Ct9H300mP11_01660 [Chloroflexota bacterium]|nr:MAG: hypothetical protein Ct9H300mP11_01660 [Chloroflexota bacterium]